MDGASTLDHRDEFDRIFHLQFGNPIEVGFRLIGVFAGSILIYAYTQWLGAWLWSGLFIGMNLLQMFTYSRIRNLPARWALRIQVLMSLISLALFIWMPAHMLMATDAVLHLAGAVTLGIMLIYLVHTADRSKVIISGQLVVLSIVGAFLVWNAMSRTPEPLAWFALVFVMVLLISFMGVCMFSRRRQRLAWEDAAERSKHAQKMEAVGQVSGGIAHDFNNLLTVILGNLDLCEETDDPDQSRQFRREARDAAERGKTVVEQLLNYARKTPISPKVHSAKDLIVTTNALQRRALPSSVKIDLAHPPTDAAVYVDENLFVTAMINIIANASDALGARGVIFLAAEDKDLATPVTTLSGEVLDPGRYVSFSVADSGAGMDGDVLRRATEPFFTTKPPGQGSGLGLSMASGFAAKSQGGLLINSAKGAGTTVTLLFPEAGDGPAPQHA